jgi:putative nucleotidyltransferase with HDIG domain
LPQQSGQQKSNKSGSKDFLSRANYEDHRFKFSDWAVRLGLERTIFGRLFIFLDEQILIKSLAIVVIFCFLIGYFITFDISVSYDYKAGDVAKSDITSPMSFEMIDELTTEEKRIKAEEEVPLILDYDPTLFEVVSTRVYKAFREMRLLSRRNSWSADLLRHEEQIKEFVVHKPEFEKMLGVPIPDHIFEWLVQSQFSARIENILIRNLENWYQLRISEGLDKAIPKGTYSLLARTVNKSGKGREFKVSKNEFIEVSDAEAFSFSLPARAKLQDQRELSKLQILARSLIFPNYTINKQELESRRSLARESVLPTSISVKKNQTIAVEGTVIQPQQVALIQQIEILRSKNRHDLMSVTMALVLISVLLVFYQHIIRFSKLAVNIEDKDLIVMGLISLLVVIINKFFVFTTETAFVAKFGNEIPTTLFLYAAPIAAGSMLVGLLIPLSEVVWLFTAFISIVMGMMTEMNFAVMVVTFVGGITAGHGVYNCKKRNDIYIAGLRTGAVNSLMIALMLTLTESDSPHFTQELLTSIPAGFISGLASSFVAMILVPVLESVWNYTTDVKLLELSNLNHPLLKEMIVKSPGTYHHSMMVGSMVEAAAEEIGANPLLGKVMSYYHDIGKMGHANYFIENQKMGHNPHDHISPYLSKTLLISHVKDGVELGMQHKLGKPIIDGIIQHHGTTLISFFYNKALDQKSEDQPEISDEEFRYPGPKPQFREAALCMLADSIEAAARSLDEPTPVRLQNIVRNIVQRKFMEGQLDECDLNLKDLSKVETAFTRILLGIYHQRIDYPKSAGGGASEAPEKPSFFAIKGSNG